VWCYSGPVEQLGVVGPNARVGALVDGVAEMPYPAWQSAFDALYPVGDLWYWRADFLGDLADEAVDLHAGWARRMPTWKFGVQQANVTPTRHQAESAVAATRGDTRRVAPTVVRSSSHPGFAGIEPRVRVTIHRLPRGCVVHVRGMTCLMP
jgi:hypothetical protein